MSDPHHPSSIRSRFIPGVRYAIAIVVTLAGPALVGSALVVAILAGDAAIIGLGMIGGAILGASGALAMLWCLREPG